MTIEVPGFRVGFLTASADIHTNQFCLVKVSGNKTVTVSAAATDKSIGVLQNKPVSGAVADIMIDGVTKAVAGAAIVAGVELMADTSGRVITATGSTAVVVGRALDAAAGAGELIPVLLGFQRIIP